MAVPCYVARDEAAMNTALRPMSTGELLDRTFTLYKRNFLLFTGIAVPAPGVILLITVGSSIMDAVPAMKSHAGEVVTAVIGVALLVLACLALLLAFALAHAATIRAVSALHLSHVTSIRSAYRELRGHYLRIVGIFISVLIRVIGGSILMYFATAVVGFSAAGAAGLMGNFGYYLAVVIGIGTFVAGVLIALTLVVRYAYAIQACVVEDISGKQALKRSVFLAKGSRSRVLTVYVLFFVLSSAIWGCLAFLVSLSEAFIHSEQVISALQSFAFFLALVLTMPLVTVAMSLAYYDERVRKEGFDLQMLIAGLEAPMAAKAAATT